MQKEETKITGHLELSGHELTVGYAKCAGRNPAKSCASWWKLAARTHGYECRSVVRKRKGRRQSEVRMMGRNTDKVSWNRVDRRSEEQKLQDERQVPPKDKFDDFLEQTCQDQIGSEWSALINVATRLLPYTNTSFLTLLHVCDGHGCDSKLGTLPKNLLWKWCTSEGNLPRLACAAYATRTKWEGEISLVLSQLRKQERQCRGAQVIRRCVEGSFRGQGLVKCILSTNSNVITLKC